MKKFISNGQLLAVFIWSFSCYKNDISKNVSRLIQLKNKFNVANCKPRFFVILVQKRFTSFLKNIIYLVWPVKMFIYYLIFKITSSLLKYC